MLRVTYSRQVLGERQPIQAQPGARQTCGRGESHRQPQLC